LLGCGTCIEGRQMQTGFGGGGESSKRLRPLGRPGHRCKDNIKMYLRTGWNCIDWIDLAQAGTSSQVL
jgi:hypothetical protein